MVFYFNFRHLSGHLSLSRVVAVNAVSLAIGIIANLALLLGMARRLPFMISQRVTIAGWYISSILLFVIIGLTPSHLDIHTEYAFGQPFVYACLSAFIYFFLASLLVFTTLYAKKGHYSPDFGATLTLPQRTLMIQSTCFIVYLICGAAVFGNIEDWRLVDGMYWATITLLTIGKPVSCSLIFQPRCLVSLESLDMSRKGAAHETLQRNFRFYLHGQY